MCGERRDYGDLDFFFFFVGKRPLTTRGYTLSRPLSILGEEESGEFESSSLCFSLNFLLTLSFSCLDIGFLTSTV